MNCNEKYPDDQLDLIFTEFASILSRQADYNRHMQESIGAIKFLLEDLEKRMVRLEKGSVLHDFEGTKQ